MNSIVLNNIEIDIVTHHLEKIFQTSDVEWHSYNNFYVKVLAVRPEMIQQANQLLFDSLMSLTYMSNGKYVEVKITAGEIYHKILKSLVVVEN